MNLPNLTLATKSRRPEAFCGPPRRCRDRSPARQRPYRADRRCAMTVKPPAPPPLPDELDRLLQPPAHAICSPSGAGGDRDRHQPTLGTRRGPARPLGRGGRRPRPRDHLDAPPRVGSAGRQDVRRLGGGRLGDPCPDTERATDPRMGQPRRSPRRLRPERKREIALHRSARAPRDRQRPHRLLAHARLPRRPVPPPPRRRQHQQSDHQTDPLRPHPDRRCRPVAGFRRRRRRAVPRRRRRLRETLDRDQLQHPPRQGSTN